MPIAGLYSDPLVRTFLGGAIDDIAALAASRRIVEGTHGAHAWAVRRASDNLFCGLIVLGPHHDGQGTEISYLFDPAIWGTGIAGESVMRALDYAQHDLGISPILAETRLANKPSRRLLERCGMRQITTLQRFGAEQALYSTVT